MKQINEFLINKNIVNTTQNEIRKKLRANDKENLTTISEALDVISCEISNWVDEDEEREGTGTDSLGHMLSQLAGQLRGDWEENITFEPGMFL